MALAFILLLSIAGIFAYGGYVTLKMTGQRQKDGTFVIASPLTGIILTLSSVTLSALFLNAAFLVI